MRHDPIKCEQTQLLLIHSKNVSEPYNVEENVTIPEYKINYVPVLFDNSTLQIPRMSDNRDVNCDNKCKIEFTIKKFTNYSLNINLSFNITAYTEANNRTIPIYKTNITLKKMISPFYFEIDSNPNEKAFIDKSSIKIEILPNEFVYYINKTETINHTELQNVTKYRDNVSYYVII